jgi:K319L-like, PKD domain
MFKTAIRIAIAAVLIGCSSEGGNNNGPVPIADAGPDQVTRPGFAVTLDGNASVAIAGGELSFLWQIASMPDGGSAVFGNPTSDITEFTPSVAGNYEISLTVTEQGAGSASDPANIDADEEFCPEQYLIGESCMLTGDKLDFAGTIYSFPDRAGISEKMACVYPNGDTELARCSTSIAGGAFSVEGLTPATQFDVCISGSGTFTSCRYGVDLLARDFYIIDPVFIEYTLPSLITDEAAEDEGFVIGFIKKDGAAVEGYTVGIDDPRARVYYYNQELPDVSLDSTVADPAAFLAFAPAGQFMLRVKQDEEVVREYDLKVEANQITYLEAELATE